MLKISSQTQDYLAGKSETPIKITKIAKELHEKCPAISARKFEKYLSKACPPKELSISFQDIVALSKLSAKDCGPFVSYLMLEEYDDDRLTELEKKVLSFMRKNMSSSHRRALNASMNDEEIIPALTRLVLQARQLPLEQISLLTSAAKGIAADLKDQKK
ncbi:MAG: hypothetical protein HRU09_00045 [Oligoflexales bacterium]|nr:hypothetical protein [Oligoflexales bacterium]